MNGIDTLVDHVLENERVLLRPLLPGDEQHFLPFSLNEPEIWKYSLQRASGADGLREYLRIAFEGKAKGVEYPFIVFDKRTNEYAGSTRFYDIQPANQAAQLGYTWYGGRFQRTGLNRHCKLLMLQFAFETCGLERVEFRADANNAGSIAAMKAIGCTEEGILRQNMPNADGGRRNSIVLSILREEWFGGVKEALSRNIDGDRSL